jgi:uncharacterized membrane protein YcaP (DUF421 family)
VEPFDWNRLLIGDHPYAFLWEVAFRTLVSFFCVVITLRLLGRRSVQQLTVFELVVILALGSAAGDVAFYHDVPLLPVLMVFLVIIAVYRLMTYFVMKSGTVEKVVEGTPLIFIQDGHFLPENFDRENISFDEFLMELRDKSVEHLGQVRLAIAEVSGTVSVYFFDEKDVLPGLSILPGAGEDAVSRLPKAGNYSCCKCGLTDKFEAKQSPTCPLCGEKSWVASIRTKRIS